MKDEDSDLLKVIGYKSSDSERRGQVYTTLRDQLKNKVNNIKNRTLKNKLK